MRRTVRYDAQKATLVLHGVERGSHGLAFVAHISDLVGHSALDLRDALRAAEHHGLDNRLEVSDVDEGYFDEETASVTPVTFELDAEGQLRLRITFLQSQWEDDEQRAVERVQRVLAPLLLRHKLRLMWAEPHPNYVTPPWPWEATLRVAGRSRTVAGLYAAGLEAVALMEAASGGQLTRATVGDLLRAGQAQVLLGQPEGDWLDAKTQHYDLSQLGGKVALCQAVARFANGEHGGIVVVGMGTKKVPGGEQIRTLTPVPHDPAMVRRYQQALEQHLYPPPDLLRLDGVPVAGGMLVVIDVAPQPEEHKPFLVHGAIVDGRHEGAFISVVRRRGESSIPITAAALHTTLAAGRALLRHGGTPAVTSSGSAQPADPTQGP